MSLVDKTNQENSTQSQTKSKQEESKNEDEQMLKIKKMYKDSPKSSGAMTPNLVIAKKRASQFIKFEKKAFLLPDSKSRRSSQFFQSFNASMVGSVNLDVSVIGGEYSDISVLY